MIKPFQPASSPNLAGRETTRMLEIQAHHLWRVGRLEEAKQCARRLLAVDRDAPRVLFLLGNLARDQGAMEDAETWYRRCIKVAPHNPKPQANLGGLLLRKNRKREALTCFQAAVRLAPTDGDLVYNLAQCYRALERYPEAIASYRRALDLKPELVVAGSDLASVLALAGQEEEAEVLCRELSQRHPLAPEPRLSLGGIYRDQGRLAEARLAWEEALRLAPQHRQALLSLAALSMDLNDLAQARRLIETAASGQDGNNNQILSLLAELHARQGDNGRAAALMTRVLATKSGRPGDYLKLAAWHAAAHQRGKSVAVLEEGLRLHGNQSPRLLVYLFYNLLCLGQWRHYHPLLAKVLAVLRAAEPPLLEPFIALQIPDLEPEALGRISQRYARRFEPWIRGGLAPAAGPRPGEDGRLRIGYLSADLHEHATAYLAAGVFERHDTRRFAVTAYSYGPDDQSPTRERLRASFECFRDIRSLDHQAAAERIRADGIDILVDLKGYTRLARPEILALRPAPLQVNWLGYPGTLGATFVDYMVVDERVVPPQEASAYQEALAYLPHAYAPVDTHRQVAPIPSRAQAGLPERGFVFCCFNNPRKITPDFFYLWCDLLIATPDAVLWLFARQEEVIHNLRREAKRRGIDPERILFAARVTQEEHLARLSLADLVLDTLPYNAHTTTADALFMGVPVLTCEGKTFPGRVAASLLHAAGLPELVTQSLDEYRAKALHLASDPQAAAELRQRLRQARANQPYFDTTAFTRHLEALYLQMWRRHEQGLAPAMLAPLCHHTPEPVPLDQ